MALRRHAGSTNRAKIRQDAFDDELDGFHAVSAGSARIVLRDDSARADSAESRVRVLVLRLQAGNERSGHQSTATASSSLS